MIQRKGKGQEQEATSKNQVHIKMARILRWTSEISERGKASESDVYGEYTWMDNSDEKATKMADADSRPMTMGQDDKTKATTTGDNHCQVRAAKERRTGQACAS